MGTLKNHKDLYLIFKKDAENRSISNPSRVELYFLSAFHLIESCTAKFKVHINKHQRVRKVLEMNHEIFQDNTETIWHLFHRLENQIRPKFSYGFTWTEIDFDNLKTIFYNLEKLCLKVLENES